jgi:ferric iron reductase protein FhuF
VALVVSVMRALLAQAVALDTEAKHLRAELDEVI